ncbi:MAG: hypothetical protein H6Q72_1390 [Firmicutes bacterium]|nr:hypothetical protein [Bacillota bacterium]
MSKTFSNEIMRRQLKEVENTLHSEISTVKVQKLLSSEFIEWDGCVLLEAVNDENALDTHFKPNEYYPDRTEYEAFCNHIHISDYLPESEECPLQSLVLALKILEVWESKLMNSFPGLKFHLILSHDEFGSVLRFHKFRQEEGLWINVDNINGYTEQGIMLKEI